MKWHVKLARELLAALAPVALGQLAVLLERLAAPRPVAQNDNQPKQSDL